MAGYSVFDSCRHTADHFVPVLVVGMAAGDPERRPGGVPAHFCGGQETIRVQVSLTFLYPRCQNFSQTAPTHPAHTPGSPDAMLLSPLAMSRGEY